MRRNRENKPKFEDEGRTVANMNVEGMPWYNPSKDIPSGKSVQDFSDWMPKEKRAILGGILAAALLVGGIFIGGAFLLILFCTQVWFG